MYDIYLVLLVGWDLDYVDHDLRPTYGAVGTDIPLFSSHPKRRF